MRDLVAPLSRGEDVVGMLVVRRRAPGAFSQNTVELVKTFAAQSALAIQNARLFHEIEDKGRELEVASRHKSQFLANMSHELRTPLNAILGYTELILDEIYGEVPEKTRGVLERVQTNGKHLLGLINDVLDLSKIEAGQLSLSLSEYSLANLVHGVYAAVEPLAAKKDLALTTKIAPSLPAGHGDERRLSQVLLNLVGNAIKFTDKGEVAIEASLADGSFRLAVRDSGPGHRRRRSGENLRGVPTGRQHADEAKRRHRIGPRDLQAHRRDARRPHRGGFGTRQGFDFHHQAAGQCPRRSTSVTASRLSGSIAISEKNYS